ncbi:MAG: 4-(cytidine 5'-diphospho)-2-C-methyl-D-erythritol kinase [Thermodesulfobacteriota bacterium]
MPAPPGAASASVCLAAPAKINLFLRVVRRRPDGYHDLVSLMQKLALHDRVELAVTGTGITLTCPDSALPADEGNLAFRAAVAFLERTGLRVGIDIVLSKTIPIAAGLGGGSSDAATVLLGLNELCGLPLRQDDLLALGTRLGADVPFFLLPAPTALATGTGVILDPRPAPGPWWVVLVNPGFPVSTAWAYENLALTREGNPYMVGRVQAGGLSFQVGPGEWVGLGNDLEAVTAGRYPEIVAIKTELLTAGAVGALMSGSGPTVFGLFDEEQRAQAARSSLLQRHGPGVFLTHTLS